MPNKDFQINHFVTSLTVLLTVPLHSYGLLKRAMSVVRSLRQLVSASSRTFGVRQAHSIARVRIPVLASHSFAPATRAFSVSARRFGEGTCESNTLCD